MEKRSNGSASLVLGLLMAASLSCQCHGARDVPAEKPLRPQNVFGFGGFYPGPTVNWVFPGPNGVTPQVGFGGMPGSSAFPGGGGVVGIHGGAGAGAGAGAVAKKP
ncbi:hypothetical protein Zm00014a_038518 [Zea mays]|jgi:hypothetical protein|uniref:Uncharacterized protein n=2 Tax=Zea mays TaxID=4577 RepID=B6TSG6_MAIZE|nr:uncharacterized protein LOC100304045 precursor [Zea mays]ACG40049.1 hypothetical protein [Zea mays]ONM31862.1 hypothetical protein ZEAMMB73_Zm00001d040710 [Zea mays]PWZ31753.1 hypothetical protein Zm00014a_038518 [Zea mays]|eukprot:NP_001159030.1 uncharacterized protein LOC100304045 precursor [Zea mays]